MVDYSKPALARKTILGFAQLLIVLGILLMAPVWTLDYWQAWVFLAIFAGASGLITTYLWKKDPALLERRVNAGPAAEKEKKQKIIQAFASLAFIGLLVLPALDHRFGWSHVPVDVVIAGDALVAFGFFFIFLVFKENSFTAATIEVAENQKVISTGPYAVVRHPMYLGAMIMLLGTPLALGSWWGILMVIPMAIVIMLRLLDEERFLMRQLPGYDRYCEVVRYHLIPYLW